MPVTLNVFVKDQNGQPVANARVVGLTRNQIIDPPTRFTSGDGGANLYYRGPVFNPPVAVSLVVDAPGYAPYCSADQPILLGQSDINFNVVLQSFRKPFQPAPRFWKGNMCGVRVPGLPPVPGGAADASLVLSWFYDRYAPGDRARIRATWKARGLTHVLLSWPDSRVVGRTPQQFLATCTELLADGFFPCPMFCSKDHDPPDVAAIQASTSSVLPHLVGVIPLACVGWELSLWLNPTEVQTLIDWLAPKLTPSGCRVYVHFQQGYMSFQQPGLFVADFWKLQVGKLTGVLRQKVLAHDRNAYRFDSGGIVDVLQRMAGNFNMPADSGFGHPFDDVELEITATHQFNGTMSEAEGDDWGQWAIDTPAQSGPAGKVSVMGSGNGARFKR